MNCTFLRKTLVLFAPLTLIACQQTNNVVTTSSSYVIDGDTFDATNGKRYRLVGIDTPEISKGEDDTNDYNFWQTYYGEKSKVYVSNFLNNKKIKAKELKVDKYGRTVAHILDGDNDLSLELVERGLARVAYISVTNPKDPFYTNDFAYYERLLELQHKAYSARLGIWEDLTLFGEIFP